MRKKARYKNKNRDKELAILEDRNWYVGSPHKCGSNIRYVSNGLCHFCECLRGREKLNSGRMAAYRDKSRMKRVKNIRRVSLTEQQKRDIVEIYRRCRRVSADTGIPYEVDHIIPLCKGGLHHPDNLQIITRDENRSKGSTYYRHSLRVS